MLQILQKLHIPVKGAVAKGDGKEDHQQPLGMDQVKDCAHIQNQGQSAEHNARHGDNHIPRVPEAKGIEPHAAQERQNAQPQGLSPQQGHKQRKEQETQRRKGNLGDDKELVAPQPPASHNLKRGGQDQQDHHAFDPKARFLCVQSCFRFIHGFILPHPGNTALR